MAHARKTAGSRTATAGESGGFTAEERAAMKERAQEVRASTRRASPAGKAAEDEAAVLAKIAEMRDSDRVVAERIHAVVRASAPHLAPKLWYGMPAYARDGKVVCFFQSAQKFNARYATLGFSDSAHLDDGTMWPTAYALAGPSADVEARIAALVERAAG
ncbi:iron chaperone [Streptomyces sp. NPDC101225]|uniref:iron chaperone n=1 Tax=Streptomyces sp. NPDC101225 TaxID=3366135 RepID=UPI0037FF7E6C